MIHQVVKLVLGCAVLVATAMPCAAQQGQYARSSPQSKEFTFTAHYQYVERQYAPAVVIPRISEPPAFTQLAEETLVSQFSAIDALDYDWWLSTWDDEAQKKFAEREPQAEAARKNWKQLWEGKAGKLNVKLTRWIISGQYVILAYTLSTADQKGTATLPETATAFRQWNGSWKATLDLEGDPILLHFADTKTRFERVVRP